NITAKKVAGSATSHIFQLDITPQVSENPNIFANAAVLSTIMRTRSTETLEKLQTPNIFQVNFHDVSDSIQFFWWMRRGIKQYSDVYVKTPLDPKTMYVSLMQGVQKGKSYQAFAAQVGTFIYQKLSGNSSYSFDTQANPNPGRTF